MDTLPQDVFYILCGMLEERYMMMLLASSKRTYEAHKDVIWEWFCELRYKIVGLPSLEAYKELYHNLDIRCTHIKEGSSTTRIKQGEAVTVSMWVFPTIHWFVPDWKEVYLMGKHDFPFRELAKFEEVDKKGNVVGNYQVCLSDTDDSVYCSGPTTFIYGNDTNVPRLKWTRITIAILSNDARYFYFNDKPNRDAAISIYRGRGELARFETVQHFSEKWGFIKDAKIFNRKLSEIELTYLSAKPPPLPLSEADIHKIEIENSEVLGCNSCGEFIFGYSCDSCHRTIKETHYDCTACSFDVCLECYQTGAFLVAHNGRCSANSQTFYKAFHPFSRVCEVRTYPNL